MNIFVGNLAWEVSDEDLSTLFATHGSVDSARVIRDRFSGRSRGFGFVEMSDNSEAETAIAALSGANFQERPLTVNEARPREEREPRGSEDSESGNRW